MAKEKPRVSACIPCYNGARYLAACLDSVLAQTFTGLEILVMDDGSTDESVAIARDYAARDARVRVVAGARAGMVANWNRAISEARGEWVKPVFQDDLLLPECIASLLARASEKEARFVACFREFKYEGEAKPELREKYASNRRLIASLYPEGRLGPGRIAAFWLKNLGHNFVGEPTVTLIHKDVFSKVGMFDTAMVSRVDTEFWVRTGLHFGVSMVKQDLAQFRVHPASASAENYGPRAYADEWLDTAVALHHCVYDPVYEPLRAKAAELGLSAKLRAYYGRVCRRARDIAMQASGAQAERIRADWQRVLKLYPNLERDAQGMAG